MSRREVAVTVSVDARQFLAAIRRGRDITWCMAHRRDPNPFPHIRLFRWLPR